MYAALLLGLISTLVLTAGLKAGNLQNGETLLCTDPVRLEIGAGQIEILKIRLENADKIYGIDLQAKFDPAVVEVVDADSEQAGIQMLPGAFLKPDFVVRNQVDNTTGTLDYVITQLRPTPSASGAGIVMRVHFLGKTQGTSSKLTFTSAVIADRRGNKQPVTTRGAELVIVAPSPPTATPRPTHTPHPTNTAKPTAPTLPAASLTPDSANPSTQPIQTVSTIIPAILPEANAVQSKSPMKIGETVAGIDPGRIPGLGLGISERLLTFITVGGFSGAVLLLGLTVGLLAEKRRKERHGRSK
jgi:hypothetical protein